MYPLEFDDWLLHSYLHPLDNFVDAAPWRGPGCVSCITAAKSDGGEDQQPAAADSGFLKKTTAIDPLFHIRLPFTELIASAGLDSYRLQLAGRTQLIAAQGQKRELRGRFPKSAGRTA
jgi:hypothetical protein